MSTTRVSPGHPSRRTTEVDQAGQTVSRSYGRPSLHLYLTPSQSNVHRIGDFEPVTNTKAPRKSAAHYRWIVSTVPRRTEGSHHGRSPGKASVEGPVNSHRRMSDPLIVIWLRH